MSNYLTTEILKLKAWVSYGSLFSSSTQAKNCKHKTIMNSQIFAYRIGKSKCISEVHGGAGLACGPASAHYIAEQVLGYGFLRWFENKLYHATLTTYPKVCQLLLLSLGLFVKRSLNSGVEICKMYNAMRVISHTQLNTTECPFCFYFCSKHRRP